MECKSQGQRLVKQSNIANTHCLFPFRSDGLYMQKPEARQCYSLWYIFRAPRCLGPARSRDECCATLVICL